MSQFMLLIYGDPKLQAEVTPEDQQAEMGQWFAYTKALEDAGVHIGGEALHPVETAKTVGQGGVVTDGPFAETTEHLGGVYLIDVPDIDAALEWGAKMPGVDRGLYRVEARQVMVFE